MKTIKANLDSKKIGNLNETETKQLKELLSKIANLPKEEKEQSEEQKMVGSVLQDNYQEYFLIGVTKGGNVIQTQTMSDAHLAKVIHDLSVEDQELAAVFAAAVMKFLADKPGALRATVEFTMAHLEVK